MTKVNMLELIGLLEESPEMLEEFLEDALNVGAEPEEAMLLLVADALSSGALGEAESIAEANA
jgi:hypothetical protein